MTQLDDKINQHFAGLVVRKDLVKAVKGNAIVPTYVLEYLLGQYCATNDAATARCSRGYRHWALTHWQTWPTNPGGRSRSTPSIEKGRPSFCGSSSNTAVGVNSTDERQPPSSA